MDTLKPTTVDDYIAVALPKVKEHLEQLRTAILQAAPEALECISYEMPAYKLNGVLIYFGGFKNHVSLFPGPQVIEAFKEELSGYKTSKGTIRLPIDRPIPTDLIKRIVKYRIEENLAKVKNKK